MDVLQVPQGEITRLGGGRRAQEAAHVGAGARAVVRRDQHHARAARRRARAAGAQLRRRRAHDRSQHLMAGRGELRRRRDPAVARRRRHDAHRLSVRHRRRRSSCSREAGYPNGIDVELWTSHDADLRPHRRDDPGATSAVAGIRVKIVQREAPRCARRRARGRPISFVKDWYADYPDAENFLYPLLHSANKGVGGNVSFYSNPQFDALVTRGAPRAGRGEARRAVHAGRRDRVQRRADDLPLLLQGAVRGAAVDQRLRSRR